MRELYLTIKWAYQRAVRGYDDRAIWGFDEGLYLLLPALEDICNCLLEEIHPSEKDKIKILKKTLKLIEEVKNDDDFHIPTQKKLWIYVAENIDLYWT